MKPFEGTEEPKMFLHPPRLVFLTERTKAVVYRRS